MKELNFYSNKILSIFVTLMVLSFSSSSIAVSSTQQDSEKNLLIEVSEEKNITLQNLPGSKKPLTISYDVRIYSAFISPGQKYLVVNFRDVVSHIYPLDKLSTFSIPLELTSTTGLEQASFSESDHYLAFVEGKKIFVYNLQKNLCVKKETRSQVIIEAKFEGSKTLLLSFEGGEEERLTISPRTLLTSRQ